MTQTTKQETPYSQPPAEEFWQRYSPNQELPLAGMTSLFVHGLIFGVVGLGWLLYFVQRDSESSKPPSQDVVQITGGGDGFGGMGAEPGLPGEPGPKLTEVTSPTDPTPSNDVPNETATLKDAPRIELSIPEMSLSETKTDVESVLAKLEKDAKEQAKKSPVKAAARISMPGTGNPKGQDGRGGTGGGVGMGNQGRGSGAGGMGGRLATKAEIYAMRWRFNLGNNAKEHVDQLKAIGLVVVFRAPSGVDYFVKDLNRRPVDLRQGNIKQFKDAVQWENTKVNSLVDLARELKLSFVPSKVFLFLPRDREEAIAAEEFRFAKGANNNSNNIRETHFVFRMRNGHYEPEATLQVGLNGQVYKN